jgi:exosome complex component RRP45
MRPPSPSIPEKDFFSVALAQGLRLDGRPLLAQRRVELAFGTEMGHVEVAFGKTRSVFLNYWIRNTRDLMQNVNRVMAHVEATMVKPASERPYEGVLNVHAELGPMAGIEYEPGRCVHLLTSDLPRSS